MKLLSAWNHIDYLWPIPQHPILVAKLTDDNSMLTGVGRLVAREDKSDAGWLCREDDRVLLLTARPYWLPLREEDIIVPSNFTEEELSNVLSVFLTKLAYFETKFKVLAAAMMESGNGLTVVDYYISGVLNRSLSLIYGFETLLNSQNYLSGAHLVRLLLDNYLRLYALWLSADAGEVAKQVWNGTALREIADRNGKQMRDGYLRDKAAEEYPWIADVYNETSGFIHFSNKHIANATSPKEGEEMTLLTYFGKYDHKVSNLSRIEATACMIEICNCIAVAVFGWVDTKRLQKSYHETIANTSLDFDA